ncbi:hypothetical protein BT96DRAFT_70139 [Gymnopus androsaceus JB14]|uniref:Uncharacterized protein n=1 Tax=Gymnopus androsaceus JB14 TaxID=1447944 RepID=A0A6A4HHI1_9AGAR|nr:hypothetical protein BT96DRAFT_70139 [Gymnopus androsaceus JB14]
MGNLLWFLLGVGVATMYAKRRNRLQYQGQGSHWGGSYQCHYDAYFSFGPLTIPPNLSTSSPVAPPQGAVPTNTSSGTSPSLLDPWAAEKERLQEIGNQVGVNVGELSESTLDTFLSSIESMKAKVIQQRQEREQQRLSRGE